MILFYHKNRYLGGFDNTCNDAANYYADCYRYLGYFFMAVLLIGIFAFICSMIRPKENLRDGMDPGNFISNPNNDSLAGNRLNPYSAKGGNYVYDEKKKTVY